MEFIPWDNPDNLVTEEVERLVLRIQGNILAFLFLIGGPANVINMVVFCKQGLKDRVNLCLFSLSLSDGLFLITFMFVYGQLIHMQFTSTEKFTPMGQFIFSSNIIGFAAFGFISTVLSAIIAMERCLCVFNPLRFQHMIRTKTMALIIIGIFFVVLGLFFVVVFRYRIRCLYDPTTGVAVTTFVKGEFYKAHKIFIDYLDSVIFGVGLPGTVLLVVIVSTVMTTVKLRQIVTWRSDASATTLSAREIALTKMLVGNSILFIICFSPDAINHLSRMFIPEMNSGGRYHNFYLMAIWIGDIFFFFNATLNIFVYYIMGSRYRQTFWSLFRRKSPSGIKGASETLSQMGTSKVDVRPK